MNTALTIMSREMRDRTQVFIVGAVLALFPFVIAYANSDREGPAALVGLIGAMSAVISMICYAALYGINTVGRDLSDKRMSFYFAKPVSPAALWFGKMLAAVVTIVAVAALIAIPSLLFAPQEFLHTSARDSWALWKIGGAIALAFFFGGHAISTMVRSRSALVVLDAIIGLGLLLAIIRIVRPLVLTGVDDHMRGVTLAVTTALVLIFALAPVWQLARGRVDARRNHFELSRVLWPSIGVVVAVTGAYVYWLQSAPLKSLDVIDEAEQSSTGAWTLISGYESTRNYPTVYLVNEATGENERMPLPTWWGGQFTRDGKTMSWLQPEYTFFWKPARLQLMTRRLETGAKAHAVPMNVAFGSWYTLSPDGARVAVAVGRRLTVYETATGRMLGSADGVEARFLRALYFATPDVVRIVETPHAKRPARFAELDVAAKKFTITGEMLAPLAFQINGMADDASTMFVPFQMMIVDARTGMPKTTLPIDEKKESAAMLNDGSVVAAGNHTLRHFDANGTLVATIPLPVERARVMAQIGDSRVVLYRAGTTTIVDLKNRRVEQSQRGRPAVGWSRDPRLPRYAEGTKLRLV